MHKINSRSKKSPARKLKKSAVKNIVRFPTKKSTGNKTILVESLLEAAYCLHLEFDEKVAEYFPQPKTFQVPITDGTTFTYTPDFEVVYGCGRIAFVEVKPLHDLSDKDLLQRLNEFERFINQQGYGFQVVTDKEIYKFPRFNNFERLYRFKHRSDINAQKVEGLKRETPNKVTFRSLFENEDLSAKEIYTWVANRVLKFDFDKELFTMESEVSFND